nr:MAG TPA: hypothetical protein [Caudoviricetes sp.]
MEKSAGAFLRPTARGQSDGQWIFYACSALILLVFAPSSTWVFCVYPATHSYIELLVITQIFCTFCLFNYTQSTAFPLGLHYGKGTKRGTRNAHQSASRQSN